MSCHCLCLCICLSRSVNHLSIHWLMLTGVKGRGFGGSVLGALVTSSALLTASICWSRPVLPYFFCNASLYLII